MAHDLRADLDQLFLGWSQDLLDDEILAKLVALNAERAAEEKRGLVRWLRPEYQRARAGVAPQPAKPIEEQLEAPLFIDAAKAQKPAFPARDLERAAAVFAALAEAARPLDAQSIASKSGRGEKSSLMSPAFWLPSRAWVNSTPAMARVSRRAVAGDAT